MKNHKVGIIVFLIPAMLIFMLIFGLSIIVLISTSFTDWTIGLSPSFVGLKNYTDILQNKDFLKALSNTAIWIILQVTIHVSIGVIVALLLARKKFYWKFIRTVYMIPNIISAAAVGLMFTILLNPEFGIVNELIRKCGFPNFEQNWFMDKDTAFWAVTFIWLPYAATVTILILAELASIDPSIIEAARVDGATEFQLNLNIILPMLRNIIGTCAILAGTSMLQKLDVLMMTTKGGPLNYTLNMPLFIYQTALTENNFGLANSAGVYLIILGLVTVLSINKLFRMGQSDL